MTATTERAARRGGTHELVLHDGDAELVDLMVPFLRDGAAAGDRLVVLGDPRFVTALLAAVPELSEGPGLQVLAEPDTDRVPARDLHRFERMLGGAGPAAPAAPAGRPAPRFRVANQMPAMTAARWPEWRRYEAAVNVVLEPSGAWGTCGYDTGRLERGMVADLRASHPSVRTADGCGPSAPFAELAGRVRGYLDVPPLPVEGTEPTLVMARATPVRARQAVRELAVRAGLPRAAQEAVVLATNEAVANAHLHGRPPVVLRAWVTEGAGPGSTDTSRSAAGTSGSAASTAGRADPASGRLTVAVSDTGPGPHPLVGMVPVDRDGTGGGLWIVHLLLPEVHHRTGPEGYTVTFAVDRTTVLPGLLDPG